jgi:hypothetical protein
MSRNQREPSIFVTLNQRVVGSSPTGGTCDVTSYVNSAQCAWSDNGHAATVRSVSSGRRCCLHSRKFLCGAYVFALARSSHFPLIVPNTGMRRLASTVICVSASLVAAHCGETIMIAVLRASTGKRIVLSGPIAAVQDRVDNAVAQGARIERLGFESPKPAVSHCRRGRTCHR